MTTATTVSYRDRWPAADVPAHLASLGRELTRDQAQHTAGDVRGLGHKGDGDKMIALALAAPITMELCVASDLRTPVGVSGRVDDEAYAVLVARLGGPRCCAGVRAAHT